jgi:Lrp/AsnC family transcriptional regulator, regulator for asnA, asnC and gidA
MTNDIDLQIISRLEDDGRISFQKLAQVLGVSPSTVAKKVASLRKSGIISINSIPNPDTMQLGANALAGINVSMDNIDEVCNAFTHHFNVNLVATTFGRFNLLVGVYFQTREKLDKFISSGYFVRSDIFETQIFFAKELRKPERKTLSDVYPEPNSLHIDDIDRKIISYLVEDGRYTCVDLGKNLGISTSSASKRIDRLSREDIIRFKAQIDPAKVGYSATAFIFMRVDHNRSDEIIANLSPLNEVITIMTLMNGYDMYIGTLAKDLDFLYQFIKQRMTHQAGIINIETLIGGKIMKRYYGASHLEGMILNKAQNE